MERLHKAVRKASRQSVEDFIEHLSRGDFRLAAAQFRLVQEAQFLCRVAQIAPYFSPLNLNHADSFEVDSHWFACH